MNILYSTAKTIPSLMTIVKIEIIARETIVMTIETIKTIKTSADIQALVETSNAIKLMETFKTVFSPQEEYNDSVEHITRGLQMGWLHPIVGKTYRLEEASTAHKDIIEGGGTKGKMVLLIEDSKMFALL